MIIETTELFSLLDCLHCFHCFCTVLEESGSSLFSLLDCFYCFGRIWKLTVFTIRLFSLFWKNLEARCFHYSTVFNVLEDSGSSLFSLFRDCFVLSDCRGASQKKIVKTVRFQNLPIKQCTQWEQFCGVHHFVTSSLFAKLTALFQSGIAFRFSTDLPVPSYVALRRIWRCAHIWLALLESVDCLILPASQSNVRVVCKVARNSQIFDG